MNSVHDMGGMDGMGRIAPEADEPVFHGAWEARALALTLAAGAWRKWSIDAARHARESIPGPDYLTMSYYRIWITALEAQLVDSGLVTAEELTSGAPDPAATKASPPLTAERVAGALSRGGPSSRQTARGFLFQPGDVVVARNRHPAGHTRLPRYVRGRVGVVERTHGSHVFPDTNAHGLGENPQPLYTVRFTARELWGERAHPRDTVRLDLWEDYLDLV